MKPIQSVIAVLLAILAAAVCCAAPTLTPPTSTNSGAGSATLVLKSSENGTGYFTLRSGSNANCDSGDKVAFGPYSSGSYHGSLPLSANVASNYTIRNLAENSPYTVCFTADAPTNSNLNPTPVFANISTSSAKTFSFPGWQSVGNAGFSVGYAHFTTLAFAPDGSPHVAYVDANDSYRISVRRFDGSDWNLAGSSGFAAGAANPAALAFAPDGTAYLSFVDATSTTTVMKFTGTWNALGSGLPADTDVTSLAFAPDSTPYVAYIDGVDSKATVMQYSAGNWNKLSNSGISISGAWSTSLATAPNGTPYVAYSDYDKGGKATVMQYNGTNWEPVVSPGFTTGTATNGSLAIAPDGTLYLAYQDGATSGKATVMKFSGGAWSLVGAAGFSAGTATNISLAIAPDGAPYVAYQDGANSSKLTVLKYTGSTWNVVGSTAFSAASATSMSLAFAPDGSPLVAYSDEGYGSRATVMQLVDTQPTISGTPTATATVGMAYSFTPTATYATSFSHTDNLPPGLDVNPDTGVLSGIPTTVGTYSDIVITASNSVGSTNLPAFSIVVSEPTATGSVKIGTNLYPTIGAALATANDGDSVEVLASILPEGVNYSGIGVNTLAGGFDADWNLQPSLFSPVSSITITSGTLIIDRIAVQ